MQGEGGSIKLLFSEKDRKAVAAKEKERARAEKPKVKATKKKPANKPTKVTVERCIPDTKDFKQNTELIQELHTDIKVTLGTAFEKAMAIGDLLFRQKEVIKFGHFGDWIERDLPFIGIRTAQRYLKLFQYKKALAKAGVLTITDAYHHIFGEPISDEVREADDSPTISNITATEMVDIEDMNLPKVVSKGIQKKMTLNHDNIDRMISGKYFIGDNKELREKISKIVIELKSNANCNDRIGEFVVAAEKYLRPGGKIIFVKV